MPKLPMKSTALEVPARQASSSDLGSNYGSRSHKKSRPPPDEVRISKSGDQGL